MSESAATERWEAPASDTDARTPAAIGLSAKLLLVGGLLCGMLIAALLLTAGHLVDRHVRELYLHKAQSIAAAIDSSIGHVDDLRREDLLQAEINRCIGLNPDIDGLTVFALRGPALVGIASNRSELSGTRASNHNLQAFHRDRVVSSDADAGRGNLIRVVAPLHAESRVVGTVQVDLSLEDLRRLQAQIRNALTLGALPLALVALGLLALFLRRRIVNPLTELGRGAREIAAGNFGERVRPCGADEIGMLGREFNRMAACLQRRQRAMIEDNRRFQHQALHDVLTGLPNRAFLQQQFPLSLATCMRHRRRGALMLLDLDRFKSVNDTLGHAAGDQLLLVVARRLRKILRAEDFVARLGGDEFVVVLSEISSDADQALYQINRVVDNLLENLARPIKIEPSELQVTASVGIAFFPGREDDLDSVLSQADSAMYKAKQQGGNNACFFDQSMQQMMLNKANVLSNLPQAFSSDQLQLFYQPQVDSDGRVIGAEALVRWQHPQRGLLFPGEFITAIENNSLSIELGLWVLQTACRQFAELRDRFGGAADFTIAVNVGSSQFNQADFVEQVIDCLERNAMDPHNLVLEITEAVLLNDGQETRDKIRAIQGHGIRLSVDDYGTGRSSLTCLQELALDEIKLDGSLVRGAATSARDRDLIRAIIGMSKSLNLNLVAEGVETQEQFDFLKAQNCPVFQGQHFQAPLPLARLNG